MNWYLAKRGMLFLTACFFVLFLAACSPQLCRIAINPAKIVTEDGPEDLVLDTLSGEPRILVSCTNRRKTEQTGYIQSVNLATLNVSTLERVGEPPNLVFRPHGFDLVKDKSGKLLLYIISHNEAKQEHPVLVYELQSDKLIYVKSVWNKLIYSPNDVTATTDGIIYTTIEFGKRGNFKENIFKTKKGNVVCVTADTSFVACKGFCYTNGIFIYKDKLLVAESSGKYLSEFTRGERGLLKSRRKLAKIKGADNITFAGDKLIVAAHIKPYRVILHQYNPKKLSPSTIYELDPVTGKKQVLFYNKGDQISGASTGVYYKGKLYIGQIFEPYILEVEIK